MEKINCLSFIHGDGLLNNNELKRRVAKEAIMEIDSGMTIGLGSGSTMKYVLEYLSSEIKNGLDITGIPTSIQTA